MRPILLQRRPSWSPCCSIVEVATSLHRWIPGAELVQICRSNLQKMMKRSGWQPNDGFISATCRLQDQKRSSPCIGLCLSNFAHRLPCSLIQFAFCSCLIYLIVLIICSPLWGGRRRLGYSVHSLHCIRCSVYGHWEQGRMACSRLVSIIFVSISFHWRVSRPSRGSVALAWDVR